LLRLGDLTRAGATLAMCDREGLRLRSGSLCGATASVGDSVLRARSGVNCGLEECGTFYPDAPPGYLFRRDYPRRFLCRRSRPSRRIGSACEGSHGNTWAPFDGILRRRDSICPGRAWSCAWATAGTERQGGLVRGGFPPGGFIGNGATTMFLRRFGGVRWRPVFLRKDFRAGRTELRGIRGEGVRGTLR